MPAHRFRVPVAARLAACLLVALPIGATAIDDAPFPGAAYAHLQLPLDPAAWTVRFARDAGSATWQYRPVASAGTRPPFDAITVTALDATLAPYAARDMPQRMQAMLAGYVPGLALDIRQRSRRDGYDRVVYVLATGRAEDTIMLGLAQDSATALHAAEIELRAGTPEADIARWAAVLDGATLRPARPSEVD